MPLNVLPCKLLPNQMFSSMTILLCNDKPIPNMLSVGLASPRFDFDFIECFTTTSARSLLAKLGR